MATTSLWEVHQRLDKAIDYTTNIEKTKNKNFGNDIYKSLHNVIEYAKTDFKTEKQYYVTGINCSQDIAFQEMILTKKRFRKEKGILGYHGFQSFAEGEVTPEISHEIGVKLAEELWGDKFEVIVSTHLNTKHYHNHFIINSVSFVDGRKFRKNRKMYALMRKTSDHLCEEYNLSVIDEKPCGSLKIDYTKYYNSYIQKTDYYTIAKEDIDFAIKQAYSYKNFEKILKDMGYTITIRANKLSVCKPPYKRNIRIERTFGVEYSIRNIEDRILNSNMARIPFPEEYRKPKRYRGNNRKILKKDRGSLYRLFLYYCYILKVFPKKQNTRIKMTKEMRQDIKKMENITNEIKFLCRNNIKTTKELFLYKQLVTEEFKGKTKERNLLRRKLSKIETSNEKKKAYDKILNLSNKIKYLKEEMSYCEKIQERTMKIQENLKEVEEKENHKERSKNKNEFIRFS